ncbi:MAG TPA: hypothetical protein VKV73_15040 [Chloroflexota bacterium]|nr:hypothetical protein [Chloroflexota bacterium]
MTRTWLSIRVDLIAGHGEMLWPRPGRIFAVSRSHTFAQFATAIDDAFARWDRSHLHEFTRADGSRLGRPSLEDYDPTQLLDYTRVKLGQLALGEQFAYVFDFGDQWEHLCTVGPMRIDPLQTLGIESDRPLPYFGWGDIPDQYQRRWDGDDGESPRPRRPRKADLPPLLWSWKQDQLWWPPGSVRARSGSGEGRAGEDDQ